jgi:hypothetical protein
MFCTDENNFIMCDALERIAEEQPWSKQQWRRPSITGKAGH